MRYNEDFKLSVIVEFSPRRYLIEATFSVVLSCGYKQLFIIYFSYQKHVRKLIFKNIGTTFFIIFKAYPFFYIHTDVKREECYQHSNSTLKVLLPILRRLLEMGLEKLSPEQLLAPAGSIFAKLWGEEEIRYLCFKGKLVQIRKLKRFSKWS